MDLWGLSLGGGFSGSWGPRGSSLIQQQSRGPVQSTRGDWSVSGACMTPLSENTGEKIYSRWCCHRPLCSAVSADRRDWRGVSTALTLRCAHHSYVVVYVCEWCIGEHTHISTFPRSHTPKPSQCEYSISALSLTNSWIGYTLVVIFSLIQRGSPSSLLWISMSSNRISGLWQSSISYVHFTVYGVRLKPSKRFWDVEE